MTQTLTLFEHDFTEGFDWTDADLATIERLNSATGTEILRATVRRGRRELQARQQVGVVHLGARTLQILPKMYRPADPQPARIREATRNLLHLLGYAHGLTIREHGLAALAQQDAEWFEILTGLFATHLREEWQRGAIRRYKTLSDERTCLQGAWRIGDQIRRPERRHIFSVTCDEFTSDNPINRILRFVVERLWRRTRSAHNRQILGHLREWMDEVTLLTSVSVADADPDGLGRFGQPYKPLLGLARLFLEGKTIQMAVGHRESFAFVFDMNRLFEGFVAGFLARHRGEVLPPGLSDCRLFPQTRSAARCLVTQSGRPGFRLEPDLAFRRGDAFPLLIDTKYKRLRPSEGTLGISQGDMYQMFAYARRYVCPHVLLLYPQTAEMPQGLRSRFLFEDAPGGGVTAATIDLQDEFYTTAGRQRLIVRLRTLLEGMDA